MSLFLREELKEFKLHQLKRLADYYGVKYNSVTSKTVLIDRLMEAIKATDSDLSIQIDGNPMSARVRRIYESGGK